MTVQEISKDESTILRLCNKPAEIDLGDPTVSKPVNALRFNRIQRAARIFQIDWKGSKIPRGAEIEGQAIGWTQHGVVTGVNGKTLGSYERLTEFAGANHDEHRMLVYLES